MIKGVYEIAKKHWSLIPHKKIYIIERLISKTVGSIFSILIYAVLPSLIVKALTEGNQEQTIFWIIVISICYLLHIVSYYWNYWIDGIDNNYVYCKLKDAIFNALVKYDLDYHKNLSTSRVINTTAADVWNISSLNDSIVDCIVTFFKIIVMLCLILMTNVWVGLLATVIILGYMQAIEQSNNRMVYYLRKQRKFQDRIAGSLSEVLDGKLEVQVYDMFSKLQTRFQNIVSKFRIAYLKKRFYMDLRDSGLPMIYQIGQVLLYFVMLIYVFQGKFTVDKIVLLIGYYDLMVTDVQYMCNCSKTLKTHIVAVDRIQEVLDYQEKHLLSFGENEQDDITGNISLCDVSFRYEEEPTLQHINAVFEHNQVTAIVGKSGSGKSTIFNLLLRLYPLEEGIILLDGIPIYDYARKVYFSNVSVVNQKPFVFHMSIRQNLSLVDPNHKRQEEACKRVGIHDIIMNLKEGYNTILTENGSELSIGEKQLLSLARTLLSKAEVLLFDEITSSLDSKTTTHIASLLKELKKDHTIIMITHKPEMMRASDNIIVLSHGMIVGCGTHHELVKKNEYYKKLQLTEERL